MIESAIEGNFGALLQAGLLSGRGRTEASLRQTGLVPVIARSIQFKAARYIGNFRPLTVSLDGQSLSLISLDVTPTYTLYGADITTFAGSIGELWFTVFTPYGGLNNLHLDSIVFSPETIPEPSIINALLLGALFLGWRMRRPRRP